MTIVVFIFFIGLGVGYFSKKNIYLGTFDPLKILAFQEATWVATIVSLYLEDSINLDQITIFTICILLWWGWWLFLSIKFGLNFKNAITTLWTRVVSMKPDETFIVFTMFSMSALIYLWATIYYDGGGDDRITTMKLIRPIEGFYVLLLPVVFFKLLINKNFFRWPLLCLITLVAIITGGKSAIFIILLPITIAQLLGHININYKGIIGISSLVLIGLIYSILLNYNAISVYSALAFLGNRILLEGDIYILAFANGGLNDVHIRSIFAYVFSPIIKFLYLPIPLDQNIGSQISSAIVGYEVPTGPNGHWTVLMMAYLFNSPVYIFFISNLFFGFVIFTKLRLFSARNIKRLPFFVSLPLSSFLIQFPQTFFADPSNQFIYFVHVFIVAFILALLNIFSQILNFQTQVKS